MSKDFRSKLKNIEVSCKIGVTFVFILCVLLCVFTYIGIHRDITRLDEKIYDLRTELKFSSSEDSATDDKIINFMQNETSQFRSYAERQINFVILIVGIVGALTAFGVVWMGWGTKSDAQKVLNEVFDREFNRQLADVLQGENKVEYLRRMVNHEKKVKEKKIAFIVQDGEVHNTIVDKTYDKIQSQNKKIFKFKDDENMLNNIFNLYDVVVFEVDEREYVNDDNNFKYNKIIELSKKYEKYTALYVSKTISYKIDKGMTINIANTGYTLLQCIYSMLDVVAKNSEVNI